MVPYKLIPLLAGVGLVMAVAACDESEQGRVLQYEKGTYLGKGDSQLTDEQRDELRSRVLKQGG